MPYRTSAAPSVATVAPAGKRVRWVEGVFRGQHGRCLTYVNRSRRVFVIAEDRGGRDDSAAQAVLDAFRAAYGRGPVADLPRLRRAELRTDAPVEDMAQLARDAVRPPAALDEHDAACNLVAVQIARAARGAELRIVTAGDARLYLHSPPELVGWSTRSGPRGAMSLHYGRLPLDGQRRLLLCSAGFAALPGIEPTLAAIGEIARLGEAEETAIAIAHFASTVRFTPVEDAAFVLVDARH